MFFLKNIHGPQELPPELRTVFFWIDISSGTHRDLLIYSSETGLWRRNTVHLSLDPLFFYDPIGLDGKINWIAGNSHNEEFVVSINVYTTNTNYVQWCIAHFHDLGKNVRFKRICRICQGFLMYVDGSLEDKQHN